MMVLRVLLKRLLAFFTKRRRDAELDAEIQAHLDQLAERHVQNGATPDAARAAARREFGGVEAMKEAYRQQRGLPLADTVARDIAYTLRQWRANPAGAVVSAGSVALGIAATTAAFAFLDALVLHPIPYEGADRMVRMSVQNKQGQGRGGVALSGAEFAEFERLDLFDGAIASAMWDMTMTASDRPVHVRAGQYSGQVFAYYGVSMERGRPLTVADVPLDGEPAPVVVLSYRFWQRQFGARDDIVGQSIRLDGNPLTVVGVASKRFTEMNADVYVPLQRPTDPKNLYGIQARLRSDLSLTAAEVSLQPWVERLKNNAPSRFVADVDRIRLVPLTTERGQPFRGTFTLLLVATTALLALGCANVSILLLARAASRRHEMAVRAAIGATRRRLIGQLLVESLMLAVLGSAIGVFLTWWGVPEIVEWLPKNYLPVDVVIGVNSTTLAYTTATAMLIGVLFGLSPALHLSRPDLRQIMQGNALMAATFAGRKRTHHVIIAVQVALSVFLLAGAATTLTAFLALTRTALNFDHDGVLVATLPLAEGSYASWSDRRVFFERIRERVSSIPGVENAAVSFAFICCAGPATPPLMPVVLESQEPASGIQPATVHRVTPTFFSTLRVPLRSGRIWSEAEHSRATNVAVVAQQAASQLWPGQDPIGQRVRLPQLKARQSWEASAPGSDGWLEVIGVVADVPTTGLRQPSRWPVMYVPFTLNMGDIARLIVRTRGEPLAMLNTIERQIQTVDPNQPISNTETANDILRFTGWGREQMVASVLLVIAGVGLTLASVGLYSVVSYIASQGAREFGIRRALGAGSAGLIWRAMRSTMIAVAVGTTVGGLLSMSIAQLTSELTQLDTRDPLIVATAVLVLITVALLASVVPAWRASRSDPLIALRSN